MKTYNTTPKDIKREWHLIDVKGRILGRVATEIVQLLIGKNKAYFVPHLDCGDYVVVINSDKVQVTGRKYTNKIYYHHSNYPGGFKEVSLSQQMAKDSTKVISMAVRGMLPKNKLQAKRLARLKVFSGEEHDYKDKIKTNEN